MKIRTGEIADKDKDKKIVSSVKLSKGTRVGTLKLTVNGEEQDSVPVRGLGGGSSTVIGGSVDTQALWDAINNKVDVDFFKNLFTVYDSSDLEIATNTYNQTPDNLRISVGTWTDEYLSALGKNSESGGGGGGTGTVTGIAVGIGSDPIYPDYETGIVTIPAYPTRVSQLTNDSGYITNSYLSNNYYTKTDADSKFMTIAAFERVFNILDENGTKINHPYSSGIDSIKALKGLWTEQYLSALGQNSEGGGGGGGGTGTVTSIQVAPNTYRDPDSNGIIDLSNDVVSSTDRTRWNAAANNSHTHSNKSVLDAITSSQVTSWNNVASIIGEDSDTVINKWNEVVAFLATYTEADTLANLLSNKLDVQFFSSIFTVYDSNGNAIVPNTYTQVADNLKIMVGAWTEQYLSALGNNSESGGGGTGDVSHIKISSNPDVYLDPVDGIIDMSSYAATWNAKANSATTLAGYHITDANISNGTITLGSNSITPLTANSSLAWSKLTGTPTTLAGYGIGDAKISNGVITLGSSTITPVTSVGLSAPTGFSVSGSPVTKTGTLTFAYASGYEGFTTSLKEKIEALYSWFEVDANGDVKTKDTAGGHVRGFYTESFVSALGKNSQGGSSTFDEDQMWEALGTDTTTKVIATSHIPDMASTYGYLKSSALNGYATQTWVNQQGFLTTHQTLYTLSIYGGTTKVLDFKPNANASIYIKAGGDISLTNDTTNKYITLSYTHPTNGANTTISAANGKVLSAITVNSLGHVTSVSSKTLAAADIPDISATYATASRADALEGYFNTGGVAKEAAKLSTVSKTAWGQTYWTSGGVPTSISGNMTSVGNITPSANGNNLGTSSARFNIYGTGGNFSGNVSITGTLGVTGATTLSSSLSVASGITLTTTKKIYFGDTSHYLELNSTGFHFSHGVYSDSFMSALGANSSGGGGGGIDLDAMWAELQGNTGTYANAKININHIPDISSTYGYAKTNQLGSYLPLSGGTMTGTLFFNTGIGIQASNNQGLLVYHPASGWGGISNTQWGVGAADSQGVIRSSSADLIHYKGGTNYTILDSSNHGDYAYALYGGTDLVATSSSPIDLNDLTSVGSYYCLTDARATYVSNKPISVNLAFRVWVSSTIGDSNNYLRQRFQARSQVAVFERVAGVSSGGVQPSDWGDWYMVQNSLYNYLPLSGGTMTGLIYFDSTDAKIGITTTGRDNIDVGWDWDSRAGAGLALRKVGASSKPANFILWARNASNSYTLEGNPVNGVLSWGGGITALGYNAKFNADTSREIGLEWLNTSGTRVASVTYHNTAQNIILNPIGSANTYSDAVGKYSLFVGNNKLTYNTYPILHSNNYSSYALPLSGGTMTGTLRVNNITTPDSAGLLTYHPSDWTAVSNTQWGVGTVDSQGVIRSSNANLIHYKGGTNYTICDGSNTYVSSGIGYINGTAITNLSHLSLVSGGTLNSTAGSFAWSSTSVIYSGNDNVGIQIGDSVDKWQLTGDTHLFFRQNDSGGTNSANWGNWLQILDTGNLSFSRSGDLLKVTMAGTTSDITHILERPETGNFTTTDSGWYRVAQFANGGAHGNSVLLYLNRTFNHANNESFIFAITTMYSGLVNITRLAGTYNSQYFTKIRVDNPNSGYGYIDVYYAGGTNVNDVHITTIGSAYTLSTFTLNPTTVGTLTEFSIANMPGMEARNLTVINDASNTANDAMVYLENKSSNDWAMKIECGTYSYGLRVNATGGNALYVDGTIYASSEITAASDERAKNVLGDANLDLRYIADAPNVLYEWKDASIHGKGIHGGSLAQYWLKNERSQHFVSQDKDSGLYSLNYGALGTSLAISVAKYVIKHEDEITRLKKEVVKLRERVAELEERRA